MTVMPAAPFHHSRWSSMSRCTSIAASVSALEATGRVSIGDSISALGRSVSGAVCTKKGEPASNPLLR
jgi:hypothetical protein